VAQTNTTVPLILKGASGQVANIMDVQNSGASSFLKVTSAGAVTASGAVTAGSLSSPVITSTSTSSFGGDVAAASAPAIRVKGTNDGGNTGPFNLQEWYPVGGTVGTPNTYVDPNGTIVATTLAPLAGTTTQVPIQLSSGTNLTSPSSGALEYDGTNLFFTISGVRYTVGRVEKNSPFLPMATGNTYQPSVAPAAAAIASPTANTFYALPFYVTNKLTATTFSIATGTVATAGTARVGIYNAGTDGKPSTLLVDAGTVSYSASTTSYPKTISTLMQPGWYFVGVSIQTGTSTWVGTQNGASQGSGATQVSFSTTGGNGVIGYSATGVTGALPTTATWANSNLAMILPKITF
jgi:hypothetical protein